MFRSPTAGHGRTTRPGGRRAVIVADDDPTFRALLGGCVTACGCQTVDAADAMQTVMFAMQRSPAAILLDINMPGGTGVGALERLRRSTKTMHIPVVVVTGSTDAGVEEQVRELGASAYLHKPVDPELLKAALVAAMASGDEVH